MDCGVHEVNGARFFGGLVGKFDQWVTIVEVLNKTTEERRSLYPQHDDVVDVSLEQYRSAGRRLQQ